MSRSSNADSVNSIVDSLDEEFLPFSAFNPQNTNAHYVVRDSPRARFKPSFARVNSMGYRGHGIVENIDSTVPVNISSLRYCTTPHRRGYEAKPSLGITSNTRPPHVVYTQQKDGGVTGYPLHARDPKSAYSSATAETKRACPVILVPLSTTGTVGTMDNSQRELNSCLHDTQLAPSSAHTLCRDGALDVSLMPTASTVHYTQGPPVNHGASAGANPTKVVGVKEAMESTAEHHPPCGRTGTTTTTTTTGFHGLSSRKVTPHVPGERESVNPTHNDDAHLNSGERPRMVPTLPVSATAFLASQRTSSLRTSSWPSVGFLTSSQAGKVRSLLAGSSGERNCDLSSLQPGSPARRTAKETHTSPALLTTASAASLVNSSPETPHGAYPTPAIILKTTESDASGGSASPCHALNGYRRSARLPLQCPENKHTGEDSSPVMFSSTRRRSIASSALNHWSSSSSKNSHAISSLVALELEQATRPSKCSPSAMLDAPWAPARVNAARMDAAQPAFHAPTPSEAPTRVSHTLRKHFSVCVAPAKTPGQQRAQALPSKLQQGCHARIDLVKANEKSLHKAKA
ncbi:hypothetical protein JKF63_01422 [Porcisia hertigi]|uniref:Uncharacterized protein n=1 Tax=Porcisia hertigi TaxID=2761500 RepID=A0A836HUP8_9TRYP|nr:hypothetical protein JKF63_01422 [Porcisia hertigi]